MKSVLLIAHDYPPINSASAQRVLNFAQYLPEFGYRPVILTTARYGGLPEDAAQPVYRADDLIHNLFRFLRRSRETAVPQEAQFRVATIPTDSLPGRVRDAVMIPDTKLGWLPPAVTLGRRLISEQQPTLIFSSSPPETAHLVAARLNSATGIPWVADMQDGWLFEPPNPDIRRGTLRRYLEGRLERHVVRLANAIVTATAPIADDLSTRYPDTVTKIAHIANGYDQAEYRGLSRQRQPAGTFLIVYTGALSTSRRGTDPGPFFAAVAALLRDDPHTPLRVRFVGNTRPEEQDAAHALGLADMIQFLPPVSRREAHQHQLDADALLLITASGQRSVTTLKLFDYIGAGRPILALAAGNAAEKIVQDYGLGITVAPDDPNAIAQALKEMLALWRSGASWPGFAAAQARFEYRGLTAELAALFDQVLTADDRR